MTNAPTDISKFLRVVFDLSEGVIHVRGLKGKGRRKTVLGYFDSVEKAEAAIATIDGQFENIAVGLNPFPRDLLARCANRFDGGSSGVSDDDVTARKLLAVDIDSQRPSGVSATEAELAEARGLADVVKKLLRDAGFPDPIESCSGNGFHLIFRIELPTNDDGLVKRVLEALHLRCSTETAKVDVTLGNASRLLRVAGTQSCKGDSSAERPYRRSHIIAQPEPLGIVDRELMEAVASWIPQDPTPGRRRAGKKGALDIASFARDHGLAVRREKDWNGHRLLELEVCPFNPEHTGGCACLIQFRSGAFDFKCHHDSCEPNRWKELRALFVVGDQSERVHSVKGGSAGYIVPRMCTDTGNAERLCDRAGDDLRYVQKAGGFVLWDGRRWRSVEEAIALAPTKHVVRSIAEEAQHASDPEVAQAIRAWAVKSESLKHRRAMLTLFCSEDGMSVPVERFDVQPTLVNFLNGTVDIDKRVMRAHTREDWITKIVPYDFDAKATAPRFEAFLERILPDEGVRSFVQRIFGCALLGSVEEHILPMFIGEGANGKSTLLMAVQSAFGPEYAKQGAAGVLMQQKHKQHPTEIADFAGTRLVVCSEIESGQALDEAKVKSLTGGDPLRARWMGKDFFEFEPTHTIVLAANTLPKILGRDVGIWRRIFVVPFEERIPDGEQDRRLVALLKLERAGIMRWAIDGYTEWRRIGLAPPSAVCAASERYRYGSDVVSAFLADCCKLEPDARCAAAELEAAYMAFAQQRGGRQLSWKDAQQAVERRGVVKSRLSSGVIYKGVALVEGAIEAVLAWSEASRVQGVQGSSADSSRGRVSRGTPSRQPPVHNSPPVRACGGELADPALPTPVADSGVLLRFTTDASADERVGVLPPGDRSGTSATCPLEGEVEP